MDSIGNTQPDTQEIDRVGTAKLISIEKKEEKKARHEMWHSLHSNRMDIIGDVGKITESRLKRRK